MPELPEVETIRQDLNERLIGYQFKKVIVYDFRNVAPSASFLTKKLVGLKIIKFDRRGKLLIIRLSDKNLNLLIHLKMTGQLILQFKKEILAGGHSLSNDSFLGAVGGSLPNSYTRVQFNLSKGAKLYFNDLRKFGYIKLIQTEKLNSILKIAFGPEPLDKEFSLIFFQNLLKRHKVPIKALLLNQSAISGLGNIYVDESLFIAKIKPTRISNLLNNDEVKNLRLAIRRVLIKAIKYRGTTFSDFVDLKGKRGNFSDHLLVYGRKGQNCLKCNQEIKKIKLVGRGTHYCSNCQF